MKTATGEQISRRQAQRAYRRARIPILRAKVIQRLGGKCANDRCPCKGLIPRKVLNIDHICGGGNIERKNSKTRDQTRICTEVLKKLDRGYTGFQLLCPVCNAIKSLLLERTPGLDNLCELDGLLTEYMRQPYLNAVAYLDANGEDLEWFCEQQRQLIKQQKERESCELSLLELADSSEVLLYDEPCLTRRTESKLLPDVQTMSA